MDEDKWLKYFITEDLFLVSDKAEKASGEQLPADFRGKSLMVITRADHEGILSERNAVFLKKVLKAVNLSENDYVTVYLPDHQQDVPPEILRSGPARVIIFGSTIRLHNLLEAKYKVQNQEGIQWLMADQLEEISGDVEKKKALWSALKKMFDLG